MRLDNVKSDVILKNFWRSNERFADLFNAVIFGGKEILHAECLEEMDTDVSGIIETKDYKETLTRSRDVVKKSAYGVEFIVMGIENQKHIHYAMPLRNMIYDALGYLKEYRELTHTFKNAKRKDKTTTADEFLSKMKKEDRLHPIITLTIYYGEKEWDGPYSLKDMVIEMPEEIQAIFSDYSMNLLEVRNSQNYIFHNHDIQTVFEITREVMAGRFDTIQEKYGTIKVSPELLSVIGKMTGSRELMEIGDGKEIENMCTALEKLKRDSLNQGIEQGKLSIIRNLLMNGMTAEQIKKTAGVTDEEIREAQRTTAEG